MKRPAVFFDRDGVVNVSPGDGYVLSWDGFHFSPRIMDALRVCKLHGYATILVTNQQGVGKGLMSQAALDDIHARMQAELASQDCAFDGIYACTCLASEPDCRCRKPSPQMIVDAASDHELDLGKSWLIGDYDRDIQMAINAGVPHTIRIACGHPVTTRADHVLPDTSGLAALLEDVLECAAVA